ncbi:hypothetical protein GGE68_002959 [Rhizobium leguminosarum]|uniref:GIY-YIG nuclease family protein n=1 Tax=Rhizobium leguminosarum TaxID=384 RepID=UPI0016126473|nr:hypothetical protein [Rhizobium leguminosarum]
MPTKKPSEPVLQACITGASESDGALTIRAVDGGQTLQLVLNDSEEGRCAISYLLGELGALDRSEIHTSSGKRIARWAWDRIAHISTLKPIRLSLRYVYVISCLDSSSPLCKIGIANSPQKRLAQLSTSSPHKLTLDAAIQTNAAISVERQAHEHFASRRLNGEWFSILPTDAIDYISSAIRSA